MVEVLEEKKASARIVDALAISGVAIGSELLLSPVVGNANLLSAGSKLAVGLVSSGFGKGKFTEYVGAGFLVGGSMDLINLVFGGKLSASKMKGTEGSSGSIFV